MKIENLVFYPLAEAKAKLSKVVEESKKKDILITKNGKPYSVIINYDKYVKIMDFIEEIMDVYLLDIGDPSKIRELDTLFNIIEGGMDNGGSQA